MNGIEYFLKSSVRGVIYGLICGSVAGAAIVFKMTGGDMSKVTSCPLLPIIAVAGTGVVVLVVLILVGLLIRWAFSDLFG